MPCMHLFRSVTSVPKEFYSTSSANWVKIFSEVTPLIRRRVGGKAGKTSVLPGFSKTKGRGGNSSPL